MQTLEKWGANLRVSTKGGAKVLILRPKLGGVNSVSGENLHDFEVICPASWVRRPAYGPGNGIIKNVFVNN